MVGCDRLLRLDVRVLLRVAAAAAAGRNARQVWRGAMHGLRGVQLVVALLEPGGGGKGGGKGGKDGGKGRKKIAESQLYKVA